MHICRICQRPFGSQRRCANDNPSPIIIPDEDALAGQSSVNRLAMAYRAMEIPRRKIVDFVADHLNCCTVPVFRDGVRVGVDGAVVDEVFRTDDDPSERWLGGFLNFAVEPPVQIAQRRVLVRLTLLWLALAIHNPVQAELVVR